MTSSTELRWVAWAREPRWVAWALLAVLALDTRAVVELRDAAPGCAAGTVPGRASATRVVALTQPPSLHAGDDVAVTVRLLNPGPGPVTVLGLTVVVTRPAEDAVLGWSGDPVAVGTTLAAGQYVDAPATVHLARCPGAGSLVAGWYELVVVAVEPGGRRLAGRQAVVVGESPSFRQ